MKQLQNYAERYGIVLTNEMLGRFEQYISFLLEYNEKVNLTAITEREEVIQKHFLDSLLLLDALNSVPLQASVIDIGAGAGFPGVPLKIARPDLALTLLDSLNKRITFLTRLSALIGQENLLLHVRAEDAARAPQYRESYDIATSRAVAQLPALCEYALPFLKTGGVLAAMKGGDYHEELASSSTAMTLLGGEVAEIKEYQLPNGSRRSVILIGKISQTPAKYPRKAVKIVKTPL